MTLSHATHADVARIYGLTPPSDCASRVFDLGGCWDVAGGMRVHFVRLRYCYCPECQVLFEVRPSSCHAAPFPASKLRRRRWA